MPTVLSLAAAALLVFLPSCAAVLCAPFYQCTPNCDDKVSYCDPAVESCLNNGFGGCEPIVVITAREFEAIPVTFYTATTQVYSTYTEIEPTTLINSEDQSTIVTISSTSTTTVTAPGTTITLSARAEMEAIKRDVTRFTTITDLSYCSSVNDPECTTTYLDVQTDYLTMTETSLSTVISNTINLAVASTTTWIVSTVTYTPDAVTVSASGQNDQNPIESESSADSSKAGTSSTSDPTRATSSSSLPTSTTGSAGQSTNLAIPPNRRFVCLTPDAKCIAYMSGLLVGYHFFF